MNKIENIPGVKIEIGLRVLDRYGRILEERVEQGHSFVQNFMIFLYAMMRGTNIGLTAISTSNTPRVGAVNDDWSYSSLAAPMNCLVTTSTSAGIVIGTSTQAVVISDYKLIAQVTTNWLHESVTKLSSTPDAGKTYSIGGVARNIKNNTGVSVDINEVGLICWSRWGSYTVQFLLARDIFGSPITVVQNGVLAIQYNIKATV